jgi:hypothetical protein
MCQAARTLHRFLLIEKRSSTDKTQDKLKPSVVPFRTCQVVVYSTSTYRMYLATPYPATVDEQEAVDLGQLNT